jgi:hypothetical protein
MQKPAARPRLYVVPRPQCKSTADHPAEPKPTLWGQVPFDFESVLEANEAVNIAPSAESIDFESVEWEGEMPCEQF